MLVFCLNLQMDPGVSRTHQGFSDKLEESMFTPPTPPPLTPANQIRRIANRRESDPADYDKYDMAVMSKRLKCEDTPTSQTDFSSTPAAATTNNKEGDSKPEPSTPAVEGVKSEPVELSSSADIDNSNSIEATEISSAQVPTSEDGDSVQNHPYLPVSQDTTVQPVFTSVTNSASSSFNFSMAANRSSISDAGNLSGKKNCLYTIF